MADLYLARISGMAGFERLVVVKRLASHLTTDPAATQMLFDEARIAATLSHANIVQVNDVEVLDGQVSIVMEFLHGHDVSHLIRRLAQHSEVLPIDQAVAITLGVSAGLHHAHERVGNDGKPLQIVHRDVSPHNVFVTYDGAVKLVDFGIARATSRRGKTEQGVIKGKPGYIAPETLRGMEVDRRTDVWATGVLLYEMTTGVLPFGDAATLDQLLAVASQDAPPPSTRIENYPRDLEAIVLRALARDPADRYETAEAMRQDLDTLARARKLDLSPFRLGALMERVFAPQLAAWREAQKQGKSLAEHVAAFRHSGPLPAVRQPTDIEPTVVAPPPVEEQPIDEPPRATIVAPPPMPSSYSAAVALDDAVPGASTTFRDEPRRRRWPKIVAAIIGFPVILVAGLAAWTLISGKRAAPPAQVEPAGATDPHSQNAGAQGTTDAPDTANAHGTTDSHDASDPNATAARTSETDDPAIEMPAEPVKHAPPPKKKPAVVHKPPRHEGAAPAAPTPPDPDAPLPR